MWVGSASSVFSEKRFSDRIRFISLLFGLGYAIVILRLFQLQIVQGEDFAQMSESNRTQVVFLRAPRGNFFDNKGQTLITNRPSWSLMYSTEDNAKMTRQEVETRLAPALNPFSNQWRKRLQKAFKSKQMVRLVEDVPSRVAFAMRELGELLPGARMQMEFRRGYPENFAASHLIGYLGEIDERELTDEFWADRRSGDLIGKMGLERVLDAQIRGQDGGMVIEVDSAGRLKRVIKELPYQTGNSVFLSLNYDIQKAASDALMKSPTTRGAVVVINVQTGGILAWVSSPPFNPESLVDDITDKNLPLFDRVYKGLYPPGSVYKLITAAAGFEKGLIRTGETVNCIGFEMLPDRGGKERKFRCWKTHGVVNFWKAMAESCDVYFYLLGTKVGSQAIYEASKKFGLGETTQRLLTGERVGTSPNPNWKKKAGLGGWSKGDTYNMSIGQGFVTSTPLQMAVMTGAIATRGKIYELSAVDRIVNIKGDILSKSQPTLRKAVELQASTWDALQQAMLLTITQGTGRAADIPYLDVRGKTGTAQNPHGEDHAWFSAYAGYKGQPPQIALCVFGENAGSGGSVAGPIARVILETALPDPNATPTPVTAPTPILEDLQ